jgi:hypothetical protein
VEEQIQNNVDEYVLRAKAYKIHFDAKTSIQHQVKSID